MIGHRLGDDDQDQRDDRDGDVDPEDRTPGPFGQVATEHRSDGGETPSDAEEDRQRLAPFAHREGLDHDRQGGGEHDGPAGTLDDAERHDPRFGDRTFGRQTAEGGRRSEDDDAQGHHLAVAHGVGQAATEGEERREREQVAVDRPLHAGIGETEFLLDLRYRDRHDRLVDEGHGDGEDHRGQHEIPGAVSGGAFDRHALLTLVPHPVANGAGTARSSPRVGAFGRGRLFRPALRVIGVTALRAETFDRARPDRRAISSTSVSVTRARPPTA